MTDEEKALIDLLRLPAPEAEKINEIGSALDEIEASRPSFNDLLRDAKAEDRVSRDGES